MKESHRLRTYEDASAKEESDVCLHLRNRGPDLTVGCGLPVIARRMLATHHNAGSESRNTKRGLRFQALLDPRPSVGVGPRLRTETCRADGGRKPSTPRFRELAHP